MNIKATEILRKTSLLGLIVIATVTLPGPIQSGEATFHLPPCSEAPDQADVTIYLNETSPDDSEEYSWWLNQTYYFSLEPHPVRNTLVEAPKLWVELNGLPGLQIEGFRCLEEDGSHGPTNADLPMDWWFGP